MIKLGNFEFSKPPDVFQEHGDTISIAGSLPNLDDVERLRGLLKSSHILDLEYLESRERVLVGDTHFSIDAVWGQRYELLLHKYNPLKLTRRKVSTGEVENIGEKMVSPRFRVVVEHANWKDILPKRKTLYYEVKLRVNLYENGESFRLLFKDQFVAERERHDFSKWTTSPELFVEILLGHLEQGDLLSVSRGKVARISHGIVKSCNWVNLEGIGEPRKRDQESIYLIEEGENLIAARLERTTDGRLVTHVKTFLIPDLMPKDSIDVRCKNVGIPNVKVVKVDSVAHTFDSTGAVTNFAFHLQS